MSEHRMGRKRNAEAPFQAAQVLDPDLDDPTPAPDVWRYDMEAAPRDGSEVALRTDLGSPDYHLYTWRKSRRMIGYKWEPQEGWSDRFTRQMFFDLEPVAWARYDIVDGLRKG